MNCQKCGKTVREGQAFCGFCGAQMLNSTTGQAIQSQQIPDGVLTNGDYETVFSAMKQTMLDCGGTPEKESMGLGVIESSWNNGTNMSGLRVKAQFNSMPNKQIQVIIKALDPDKTGNKKASEITQTFLLKLDGQQPAVSAKVTNFQASKPKTERNEEMPSTTMKSTSSPELIRPDVSSIPSPKPASEQIPSAHTSKQQSDVSKPTPLLKKSSSKPALIVMGVTGIVGGILVILALCFILGIVGISKVVKKFTGTSSAYGDKISCNVTSVSNDKIRSMILVSANKQINECETYLDREKGILTIKFNFYANAPTITGSFLVRLFDKNGAFLDYFTTETFWYTDNGLPPGIKKIKTSDNILQYQINMQTASYVESIEFGFCP